MYCMITGILLFYFNFGEMKKIYKLCIISVA